MKNLVIFLIVLAVVLFGGRWAWERFGATADADDAARRVQVVLAGMQEGGDEQAAASMFLDGDLTSPDEQRLAMAWDRWLAWRRQRDLAEPIRSFSVGAADADGDVVMVDVTIDGASHRIAVPPAAQLAWAR